MTEADTIERDEVAQKNRDALVAVQAETGMVISANDWNKWRPTRRTRGVIPGMPVAVTCVATDGNLGLFVPCYAEGHNLGSAFIGHVHRFEWDDQVVARFVVEDKETKESKLVTSVKNSGCPPTLFGIKAKATERAKVKRKAKPTIKSIIDSL